MVEGIQNVVEGMARRWCYLAHPDPMWPVCGTYRCPRCHRVYMVPWEKKEAPLVDRRVRPMPSSVPAMLDRMDNMVLPKAS
jgi:hypothetical protein